MALPSGYKRLQYITANGSQYLNTNRVPTANTKIIMGFQLSDTAGNLCLFGAVGQFSFRWFGNGSVFRSNGSNNADFPSGINGTAYHTVEKTATSCTLDGSTTVSTTPGSPSSTLYVMAHHGTSGATNYAKGNFDTFKWYENGELVVDYIPCESPSGAVGVWDDVNSAFISSSGNGAFAAGPEYVAPAPEYDHNTLVNGALFEVEGGNSLVGGVKRSLGNGITLIQGVSREIVFSTSEIVGNLALGASVFADVKNVRTEFIVVHQGLPSSLYDNSCNGTWVLFKHPYTTLAWDTMSGNSYDGSTIENYMDTLFNLFAENIKAVIKQVKIPYRSGSGTGSTVNSGANGLAARLFPLSAQEVGFGSSIWVPKDGAKLDYFVQTESANEKRVAYSGTTAVMWPTRSPYLAYNGNVAFVTENGSLAARLATQETNIRPAFILPQDAEIDGNFNLLG